MKTAQQWLDKMQEGQMAACVHYELHKRPGPTVPMLDWIEMIQHDAQDDFTNQVAELKSLVDAGMHESADLCNRLAEAKAENARLAAETTRLLDALIAAEYILGRVETITLKGDENPPKYHWGEAADLVHSTLYQHQLEYAASQPQKPEQSTLSAAVDKARGGPTPPKEYQGFA